MLRVEAEGFNSKEEKLSLTSDLMTSFALEKVDTPQAATSTSTTAKPFGPRPRPTTGRGIDSESPYK